MGNWTRFRIFNVMTAGLAVIGFVGALTIDNQLAVIKNDCFERLAIGNRLNEKDVYAQFEYKTVPECQRECTEEGDKCRSFSFGIGVKGNGSCELSTKVVKETADLKPIGTVQDPEFDLYIKKLGCKIVIEQKPTTEAHIDTDALNEEDNHDKVPDNYGSSSNNYKPRPDHASGLQHVHTTLISIRPDPNRPAYTGLGPAIGYHDPSSDDRQKPRPDRYDFKDDSKRRPPYMVGYEFDGRPVRPYRPHEDYIDRYDNLDRPRPIYYDDPRPPFRPSSLNHPYDDDKKPFFRPAAGDYDPGPTRPLTNHIGFTDDKGYGVDRLDFDVNSVPPRRNNRPFQGDKGRPAYNLDYDRPFSSRPGYDDRPFSGGYDTRPSKPYDNRPNDGYDSGPKPNFDRPRPGYDRPKPFDNRPGSGYDRPDSGFDRPILPPLRPSDNGYQDGPSSRPPYNDDRPPQLNRPRPINDGYPGDRPDPPPPLNRPRPINDGYQSGTDRDRPRPPPPRPLHDGYDNDRPPPFPPLSRPRPLNDGYSGGPDSNRPDPHPPLNRPRPVDSGYNGPIKDDRPRPPRPIGEGYQDRPDFDRPGSSRPPIPDDGYGGPPRPDRPGPSRPPIPDDGYGGPSRPDRPERPFRPSDYDRPRPDEGYDRPRPDDYNRPRPDYNRPRPGDGYDGPRPNGGYDRPRPEYNDRPTPLFDRPNDGYNSESTNNPIRDPNNPNSGYANSVRPLNDSYGGNRRVGLESGKNTSGSDINKIQNTQRPGNPHEKPNPIVTHSIGPHGEMITAIITELDPACYRRALAGKRVTRALVRRALPCERIEDCQQECADEKRFVCEGFNYRLDPTGRGNGDCELLDLPMVRLDMIRDIYTDPDYDVYEKDRNASPSCKGYRPGIFGGDRFRDRDYGEDRYSDRRFDRGPSYDRGRRPVPFYDDRRNADRRGDGYYYSDRNEYNSYLPKPLNQIPYVPKRPYGGYDRDMDYHSYKHKQNDWGSYGGTYGNFGKPDNHYGTVQRIDIPRHHYYQPSRVGGTPDWGRYGGSYGTGGVSHGLPSPYDIPAGDTYAPVPNKGLYLPSDEKPFTPSFGPNYNKPYGDRGYDYPKPHGSGGYDYPKPHGSGGYDYPKPHGTGGYDYPKPHGTGGYDYPKPHGSHGYDQPKPHGTDGYDYAKPSYGLPTPHDGKGSGYDYPKPTVPSILPTSPSISPLEHKFTPDGDQDHIGYNFLKDECSLRTATGFKLHKLAVRKSVSVPKIYDCELLCFKEKDFECLSYSYRYTISSNLPTDNCYLSSKSFKQLDYYTDLEPDRDFDVYTMNNRKKCIQAPSRENQYSECFWHTRSGQSFDPKIIRDAVNVKNIVECQLECIKAQKFLCRGFSFRYGSPVIGGPAENCQLIDWPFPDLDRRTHFVPEPGFEIYERGSFGHGCEPNHFSIRGKDHPVVGSKTDQLCYVGYGSPARLLPQAIKKSIFVNTELDCKAECSKTRHSARFQCMSFSYRNNAKRGETNCDLSDILQRDLLNDIDYVNDPDAWLFAWDNYNPECTSIIDTSQLIGNSDHSHEDREGSFDLSRYGGYNPTTAMDTWRVYSVSGWPCKRGSLCRQNSIGGFWYCELEGGNSDTWDYCCRPDHQCGYSRGYSYQWCYVGPARSQWRKCSEQYFPYVFNLIDRNDYTPQFKPRPYIPNNGESPPIIIGKPDRDRRPQRPNYRPNRPNFQQPPQRRPSLNEYEHQFNIHFLDPPKPGGFGQPRYWPVSYLHNESPPEGNYTKLRSEDMQEMKSNEEENKFAAIQNLIEIIKSNEINNIQYEIDNGTSKMDDILLVKIPLPTNFSDEVEIKTEKSKSSDELSNPIDLTTTTTVKPERSTIVIKDLGNRVSKSIHNFDSFNSGSNVNVRQAPVYRKGFVTRTNVTRHGRFI